MTPATSPSPNPPATCQTCFSELSASALSEPRTHITPCCAQPICATCIARHPRLRLYDPCLRCDAVRAASGSSSASASASVSARAKPPARHAFAARLSQVGRGDGETGEEEQFAIGDLDEDGEGEGDGGAEIEQAGHGSEGAGDDLDGSADRVDGHGEQAGGSPLSEAPASEIEEQLHTVSRSDTIMSIAKRYNVDPHDLVQLNNLPPSVLNTNPRILHTRRTVVVSRLCRDTRSSVTSAEVDSSGPTSTIEAETLRARAAQREAERRVKRFQLVTKTADPAIGRAYMGIAELGLDECVGEGSGELLFDAGDGDERGEKGQGTGRAGRAEGEEDRLGDMNKDKDREKAGRLRTVQLSPEERAMEAFYEDEEWERRVGGPARVRGRVPAPAERPTGAKGWFVSKAREPTRWTVSGLAGGAGPSKSS